MQAIKNLASIFEEMAPPRVAAMKHRTSIPPRVTSPQPPHAQATRVTNTTNHPKATRAAPYKPPYPTSPHTTASDTRGKGLTINGHGLTQNRICTLHHRCGNSETAGIPALTPTTGPETNLGASIHKRIRTKLAQGIRNVKGTDTVAFIFASEVKHAIEQSLTVDWYVIYVHKKQNNTGYDSPLGATASTTPERRPQKMRT
jgi:hypothetical protein